MRWGRGGRGPWKDVWNVITVCVSFVKFQNLDLTKFGDLVLEVRHVFYPSLLLPDGCSHTFLVLIQVLSEGKKKGCGLFWCCDNRWENQCLFKFNGMIPKLLLVVGSLGCGLQFPGVTWGSFYTFLDKFNIQLRLALIFLHSQTCVFAHYWVSLGWS